MKKKTYNEEKFLKKLKRDAVFSGITSIIIGVMTIAVFLVFAIDSRELAFMIFGLVLGSVFIASGIYFFRRPGIIEKRNRELDNPESIIYKKKQTELETRRKKILKKSENHKSLRYILCFRGTVLRGLFTLICMVFTFLGLATFPVALIVMDLAGILSVFRAFSGKHYRLILGGYAEHGMDRCEAESDFAGTKAYIKDFEVMSVSRKIFLSTGEAVVLSVPSIVWVFGGYVKFDSFKRKGIHSYSERTYYLFIGLENGEMFQVSCPEELCSVITDDIVSAGICVTTGYSEEMLELYKSAPDNFRYAVKPLADIQYVPVNILHYFEQESGRSVAQWIMDEL